MHGGQVKKPKRGPTSQALAKYAAELRTLRAQRDELAEALGEVGHWNDTEQARCWCSMPSMIPYRGHDGGCEAARAALAKVKP